MQVRDPVCGKEFDLEDAAACAEHQGWAHFFCSNQCRDTFQENPSRYAAHQRSPAASASHGRSAG
jgi:YHS domain-containing protein